jgi:NADPH:quinone reductase-like Zn-dependent oxidoreductase
VLLDYSKDDITEHGERFDVVYDVAATLPLRKMQRLCAPGGVLVCAGAAKSGGMVAILARLLMAKFRSKFLGQRIVFYIASIRHDDFAFIAQLIEEGKLRPVVERTFPFSETREAVRYAEKGMARAKVVITVD